MNGGSAVGFEKAHSHRVPEWDALTAQGMGIIFSEHVFGYPLNPLESFPRAGDPAAALPLPG